MLLLSQLYLRQCTDKSRKLVGEGKPMRQLCLMTWPIQTQFAYLLYKCVGGKCKIVLEACALKEHR